MVEEKNTHTYLLEVKRISKKKGREGFEAEKA